MNRVAVILAGSGSKDGSEIHESTLALLALSRRGILCDVFAPDESQAEVCNHISGAKIAIESRNCMIEAARIARGKISPLDTLEVDRYDALIVPGGFGTAKNLFSFAFDDLDFEVLPSYECALKSFHAAGKPIGAMCIAPVALAKVFAGSGAILTLGARSELSVRVAERFGVVMQPSDRREAVVDMRNRIVTTPCYMYDDATIADIEACAEAMVDSLTKI